MLNQFNFSDALWLWGLVAVPIVWAFYLTLHHVSNPLKNLEEFADKHLLPHLLRSLPLWPRAVCTITLVACLDLWNHRNGWPALGLH